MSLDRESKLGGKSSGATTLIASEVCDGKVRFNMRTTMKQRNKVIKRQIHAGHLLTADVADHSISTSNFLKVNRAHGDCQFPRPVSSRPGARKHRGPFWMSFLPRLYGGEDFFRESPTVTLGLFPLFFLSRLQILFPTASDHGADFYWMVFGPLSGSGIIALFVVFIPFMALLLSALLILGIPLSRIGPHFFRFFLAENHTARFAIGLEAGWMASVCVELRRVFYFFTSGAFWHRLFLCSSMMRRTNSATGTPSRFASDFRNRICGTVNEIICFNIPLVYQRVCVVSI